ncbi:hypothetical protein JHK84_027064 [Glycine max]|nr:hypothetical protein JHK84_027064 [Glycine max]
MPIENLEHFQIEKEPHQCIKIGKEMGDELERLMYYTGPQEIKLEVTGLHDLIVPLVGVVDDYHDRARLWYLYRRRHRKKPRVENHAYHLCKHHQ